MFFKFIKIFTVAVLSTCISSVSATEVKSVSFSPETVDSCSEDVTRLGSYDKALGYWLYTSNAACPKAVACRKSMNKHDSCWRYLHAIISTKPNDGYKAAQFLVDKYNAENSGFVAVHCVNHRDDPGWIENGGNKKFCNSAK